MNIWNKVLFVLLFLTSLTFFWLVSQRYLLGKNWETKLAQLDKDLENALANNENLLKDIYSDPTNSELTWDSMGLMAQLRRVRELQNGLVWLNCKPTNIGTATPEGFIQIEFEVPSTYTSNGIVNNSFVYLFDSGETFAADEENETPDDNSAANSEESSSNKPIALAKYLGAFKIELVSSNPDVPTNVKLISVHSMMQDELDALSLTFANQNSLIVSVDRLPVDSPSDIIVWNQSNPDFLEALKLQNNEDAEFFAKDQITLDDLQNGNVSEKRFPLDFAYFIDAKIEARNYLNLSITQKETSKLDMENVLCNQYVSLFPALVNELSEEDQSTVQTMLTKVSSSLKNPDLPTVIVSLVDAQQLKTKIDNQNQLIAQRDQNIFAAESYLSKMNKMQIEYDFMNQDCQLVQQELDSVNNNIKEMKAEIASLLQNNCELAAKIAKAQLTAAETILKNSSTVSNDPPLSLNNSI